MVSATDLKFYKSKNAGLGGDIDTDLQIISSTAENLFPDVSRAEQLAGEDFYLCMYVKNTSAEKMGDFSFWLTKDTANSDTQIKWAREPAATEHKYQYAPWQEFDGIDDFVEQADSTALDVNNFTLTAWFKTTKFYSSSGYIVIKGVRDGGAGLYPNFALYMDSNERIVGGYEDSAGNDKLIVSPTSYNDGKWHFAALTFDGSNLNLYVDNGNVGTLATSATPNTNNQTLSIGRPSGVASGFFEGQIDEVRLWNTALSTIELGNLYTRGTLVLEDNIVYENKFGTDNRSRIAQIIPNITTPPAGITWQSIGIEPSESNFTTLNPGTYKPIWVWFHVDAGAEDVRRTKAIFSFAFNITSTGTGTGGQTGGGGGSGSGGNPAPTPSNWKIAAVGDWGEENETDAVIEQILDGDYNLVLGLGDYSYTSSDSEWYKLIKDIDDNQGSDIRFEPANGNHDSENSLKSHFHLPNTHYSFDFENVHVLVLDTEKDMDDGSAQHTFAENDLTKQDSRSNIDWIFVIMHRPWAGADSDHPNNEENQIQNYMDMCLDHNVDLVMCSHNHNWQRTYPVKRSSSGSSVTRVITDSNGPYVRDQPQKWLIHVVSGTGGHDSGSSLYDLGSQPSFQAFQDNDHNGIFSIEASNGGQTLTCKFIDISGDIHDTFTMTVD